MNIDMDLKTPTLSNYCPVSANLLLKSAMHHVHRRQLKGKYRITFDIPTYYIATISNLFKGPDTRRRNKGYGSILHPRQQIDLLPRLRNAPI